MIAQPLTPGAQAVHDWQRRGADRWECRRCRKVLGFLLPGRMLTYHAGREIECDGTRFRQVCNGCGEENTMVQEFHGDLAGVVSMGDQPIVVEPCPDDPTRLRLSCGTLIAVVRFVTGSPRDIDIRAVSGRVDARARPLSRLTLTIETTGPVVLPGD